METQQSINIYKPEIGKCYRFRQDRVEVIALWPKPWGWVKTNSAPQWRHFRPSIKIPSGDLYTRIEQLKKPPTLDGSQYLLPLETRKERNSRLKETARLKWYSHIPEDIRSVVAQFPDRQFHLLSFITRCGPGALDLVMSNPALSYMLASNWVFHQPSVARPLRSARALLMPRKKQTDILDWLQFPPRKGMRRILSKIVHDAISIPSLLRLRQNIRKPNVEKILFHLDRINAGVLRIVTDWDLQKHVTVNFIEEVANSRRNDRKPHAAYLLKEILYALQIVNLDQRKYPAINSYKDLKAIHRGLDQKVIQPLLHDPNMAFPPPPVAGSDKIIPLTSVQEIVNEGFYQANCVATYVERVLVKKDYYVYKVLEPDRCTLSLIKNEETWKIDQIKRAKNREPSDLTKNAAIFWLKNLRYEMKSLNNSAQLF